MSDESKYDVAREWYAGFGAVLTSKSRDANASDHWLAGWDAGYKVRADSRELFNAYLDSIGMERMGVIRLAQSEKARPQ